MHFNIINAKNRLKFHFLILEMPQNSRTLDFQESISYDIIFNIILVLQKGTSLFASTIKSAGITISLERK